MKEFKLEKLTLVLIIVISIAAFLSGGMVSTEDSQLEGPYGETTAISHTNEIDGNAIVYDIEGLNRSVELIDGRIAKDDEYFWVKIVDTETEAIIGEHKLELSHEYDINTIEDSTEALFSSDKSRMAVSETTATSSRFTIPNLASTYIINIEDGSISTISSDIPNWRTWGKLWIDSSGKHLILVNVGDKYPPDGEAVTSYMRVFSLKDSRLTDSIIVSQELDSIKDKNGFVEASYDDMEDVIKITREKLHWLNNEMERWNIYYRIGEDGLIECLDDDMNYANRAKSDVEAYVEEIERDPNYGSKLRFISKDDKDGGYYDIVLQYYDEKYIASYNFINELISITLSDGRVITPEESEISIELNISGWSLKLGLGEKADNLKYDAYGAIPTHQLKNIGKIPIDIDIRYGEIEGCKAGSLPGKDTFVVICGDKLIPPEGSVVLYTNVEPNESRGISLVYYAPTEFDIDVSSMSAVFEIRAYANTDGSPRHQDTTSPVKGNSFVDG